MGIVVGLLEGVTAEAITPGNDPGGYIVTTMMVIVGLLLGGCLGGVLLRADPVDDL
jgi:uncharacterized membrane protein YeaQ/YmgE (transglycosylase-associated protein family)